MFAAIEDVGIEITAAGTTQATATTVVNAIAYVETVASGTGVVLLAGNPGTSQTVYNAGANPLKVYPPSGVSINQLSANTAITLPANTGAIFKNVKSAKTIAILSA